MATQTISHNVRNLTPFSNTPEGREKAREAGRKGGLQRAKNAAARKAAEAGDAAAAIARMRQVGNEFKREDLGDQAAAVAQLLLARITNGEIEIQGRDVSSLLDVLVTIVRLEEGKATSHVATMNMDAGGVLDRIAALRGEHSVIDDGSAKAIDGTI